MSLAHITQLLTTGAYVQAKREAERLIKEGNLAVADEARTWLLACRAGLYLHDPFDAARSGERALELAAAAGNAAEIAEIHYYLGSAYADIGDVGLAEHHLQAFLAVLPAQQPLAEHGARAYSRLGGVYRQRREWDRAANALARAAMCFTLDGDAGAAARCTVSEAWCQMMGGNPERAGTCLGAVEAYLARARDDILAVELLCHRALLARLLGQVGTSTALCEEVFQPGRGGVKPDHLCIATWVAGENALDLGCVGEARTFVDLALRHAVTANRPDLMNLAGGLRRRLLTQPDA